MNVIISSIGEILDNGKAQSLWPIAFQTSCCALELQHAVFGDYGFEKAASGIFENFPKHADLLIVSGAVSVKALPRLINIYNKMSKPSYIIAMGDCACNGGMFFDSYSQTKGIESVLPVDICLKGCPPKPKELIDALKKLQNNIKNKSSKNDKKSQKKDVESFLAKAKDVKSTNKEALEELELCK